MSHERSWLETRVKAKAWGERYSLVRNVAEVACWGECCDGIPSSQAKHKQSAIRPCCTLKTVLRQDPITPTCKQPTLNGAPLHAEVSAVAGPHHAKLKTTDPQQGPVAC